MNERPARAPASGLSASPSRNTSRPRPDVLFFSDKHLPNSRKRARRGRRCSAHSVGGGLSDRLSPRTWACAGRAITTTTKGSITSVQAITWTARRPQRHGARDLVRGTWTTPMCCRADRGEGNRPRGRSRSIPPRACCSWWSARSTTRWPGKVQKDPEANTRAAGIIAILGRRHRKRTKLTVAAPPQDLSVPVAASYTWPRCHRLAWRARRDFA